MYNVCMTNEEIFQLADKALKNQEKKYNSIFLTTLLIMAVGFICMIVPCEVADIVWGKALAALFMLIAFAVYFYYANKYTDEYVKIRREYTYNLVRKDERMRIKNGTL